MRVFKGELSSDMLDITQIAKHKHIAAILADVEVTVMVNAEKVWTSDAVRLGQQSTEVLTATRHQMNRVGEEVRDEHVVKGISAHG